VEQHQSDQLFDAVKFCCNLFAERSNRGLFDFSAQEVEENGDERGE
jgi:hypothetical protein